MDVVTWVPPPTALKLRVWHFGRRHVGFYCKPEVTREAGGQPNAGYFQPIEMLQINFLELETPGGAVTEGDRWQGDQKWSF